MEDDMHEMDLDETLAADTGIDRRGLQTVNLDKEKRNTDTKHLRGISFDDYDTRWGTARFNHKMMLELKVRDEEERFVFTHADADGISIGRSDPKTEKKPHVDLTRVNGLERGVSREHARIDFLEDSGTLMLTDLGSRNGTFLNGQQLNPNQQRVLRDGDDVQFGRVFIRVSFKGRLR